MTPEEVRRIAQRVVDANNDINRALLEITPKVSTKQACKMIGCTRQWLSKNGHLFGCRIINRRGDMEFETIKIVRYKQDNK